MRSPSSTIGKVALASGALAAGGAAGALIGHAVIPSNPQGGVDPQTQATVGGALVGIMLAGFGGLLVDEFSPMWAATGRWAALIGLGGVTVVSAVSFAKTLMGYPALSGGGANALPAGPTTYPASMSDSGRTLTLRVGDAVAVTLPTQPGYQWSWATSAPVVNFTSQTPDTSGGAEIDTFTAATPGTGQIVATALDVNGAATNQTMTLNLNVVS